jgi:glycosyltransferase involved in cell wall biosynthesis
MRILQTPPRIYPYTGGVENVVLALSQALVGLGHEVTIACADEPSGAPSQLDGLLVRRLWYPVKVANTNVTPALAWYLAREPFDVIHTHLPTPWVADWSVLVGRARRKGVVLTYHNDIVGTGVAGAAARLYNEVWLPLVLRLAHRVVTNSPQVLERPGSPLRAVRQKVSLVPNGVDTGRFYPRFESRTAGTIGFLAVLDDFHRYKGLAILLQAAQELVRRGRTIRLLIGGDGALRLEYQRMAASFGLASLAEFRGFVPEHGLLDFFNGCELFVLPTTDSRREGFGLVVLEAMACGLAVVVSAAAGVAELAEGAGAGLVIPPGDVRALADALDGLLSNPFEAARLGQWGRKAAESRFSWTAIARQYERIYDQSRGAP